MSDAIHNYLANNKDKSSNAIKRFTDNFNIEHYFNQHKIEYKGNQSQYVISKCPFCSSINYKGNEHLNRLYLHKENKLFICYNCNERGSLLPLLAAFEGISLRDIFARYLNKDYFEALPEQLLSLINVEKDRLKDKPIVEIKLPQEFKPVFETVQKAGIAAYTYWKQRGIYDDDNKLDIKIAKALDVRYCESCAYTTPLGKTHFINKRIIFPVWLHGDKWDDRRFVGFQGRDVTNYSELPYYISEGFPKTKVVYNYDNVYNAETITICEGIFDLIKCWDYNPICLFGKYVSKQQLNLLQKMPNLKSIILALDPDTKIPDQNGNISYNKVVESLIPFWKVYSIDIPEDKDAGDLTKSEIKDIMDRKYEYKGKGLVSLV